jgi:hypothetical protein
LEELGVDGVAVQDDIVGEMCRYDLEELQKGWRGGVVARPGVNGVAVQDDVVGEVRRCKLCH